MKKITLISPPSPWLISDRDQPFLGLLYLSSYLKHNGVPVNMCDLSGLPVEYWRIPYGDVYGITGTTPNFPYVKQISRILKGREPDCKIIVGGVHASVYPEHVLEEADVDGCIVGEGEEVLLDILSSHNLDVGIKHGTPKKDLDLLPFPDRDSINYYNYLVPRTYIYIDTVRDASIITGRGCPYKCAFCASNKLNNGKVRFRSPQNIYEELKELKDKYRIGMCNFVDDTFILDKNRVREICHLIKPLDIKWYFLTRVDHVDLELFKDMYDAGCRSVTFGFESGSNRMLEAMKKNTTVEQAYLAIEISKLAGFKVRGQLMVGFPGEDEESIQETREFISQAKSVDKWGLHVFQPYPGTDVWENPRAYGIHIDSLKGFENFHTIGKVNAVLSPDHKIHEWFTYLKAFIKEKDIETQ